MKRLLKSVSCVILFASIIGVNHVRAEDNDFSLWQKDFEKQALADGISQKTLDQYMPKMQLLPKVIETDMKKPEFLQNFWDYTDKRLTPEKVDNAKQLKHTYTTWLKRVCEKYHVPPEYLLALWSMETNLGA